MSEFSEDDIDRPGFPRDYEDYERDDQWRDELLACVADAQRAAESAPLTVEVFYRAGDPPFIVAVRGRVTTDGLAEIERQTGAEAGLLFTAGDGTYLCRPSWEAPGTGDPSDPGGWAVEAAELLLPLVPPGTNGVAP